MCSEVCMVLSMDNAGTQTNPLHSLPESIALATSDALCPSCGISVSPRACAILPPDTSECVACYLCRSDSTGML